MAASSSTSSGGDYWSGLSAHLLGTIFDRLTIPDFLRCRAVCTSWQVAASTENPNGPRSHQTPMLMLNYNRNSQLGTLHSLTEDRTYRSISLPHLHLHHGLFFICSSADGSFLLYAVQPLHEGTGWSSDLHLLNTLTGADLPLPPPPEHYTTKFYNKAFVFPSASGPLVLLIIQDSCRMAFTRAKDDDDASSSWAWTELDPHPSLQESYVVDVVFHKGSIYAVCNGERYMIHDDDGRRRILKKVTVIAAAIPPQAAANETQVIPPPECLGECISRFGLDEYRETQLNCYLAESVVDIVGGEQAQLLQVWRIGAYSSRRKDRPMDCFKVFRLDKSSAGNVISWAETKTMGECSALLLGEDWSVMLSTRNNPHLKGNCIYFSYNPSERGVQVFDVEHGSMETVFGSTSSLYYLVRHTPIWFNISSVLNKHHTTELLSN